MTAATTQASVTVIKRSARHRRPALRHSVASHGLPKSKNWEDLPSDFSAKSLIFLVGAAGFEPTTCSTQNCRATRLRYTPFFQERASIHAQTAVSKADSGDLEP